MTARAGAAQAVTRTGAARSERAPAWQIALPIAGLDGALEAPRAIAWHATGRASQCICSTSKASDMQQRMVVILHHDERIALGVFGGDVPRRGRGARAAAHPKPRALAERVERESAMLAETSPSASSIGPGSVVQVAAQEFLEGPLADEADAGAVRLVESRAGRPRAPGRRTSSLRSSPSGNRVSASAAGATPCRK